MKSLKARFNQAIKRYPYLSSYICFAEAIKNQKFSSKIIAIWFNKLVEKSDYSTKDKKELLSQLNLLSNNLEEGVKWDKNPVGRLLIRGIEDISIVKIGSSINA